MGEGFRLPRVTYSNVATDFTPVHDLLDRLIPEVKARLLGRERPNLIGGASDTEGQRYAACSPIDRDVELGSFIAARGPAINRAVCAATTAFADWSRRPWQERVAVLRRAADLLDRQKYELGIACLIEVGKSRLEAVGEADEAVDLARYYCDEMERNEGFRRPLRRAVPAEETEDLLRPLGPFAVIAPFNFPLALSVNMISAALVAGNTVVYKPSQAAGLTGSLLVETLRQAGLPDGVLNLVCGDAGTGRHLASHPGIAGVAFTGSHAVGMEIFRSLARGPYARALVVEMGGKNPAYVTAHADLEAASSGVMRSAFGLQGQKCSACSKVYVHEAVHDAFLEALLAKTAAIRAGNPEERDVFVGPVIDERAMERFERAGDHARQHGRIAAGGERLRGGPFDKGFYAAPTVVLGLPADHWLNQDELFLPFLSVQKFRSLEDAIADGKRVAYGLTAGIYTRDEAELERFLSDAEAVVLYANRPSGATTGAWPGIQSFCGWKGSGVSGKGGLGPYYLPQFMREQSRTVLRAQD
jgi:1-pyrroline-5-carboxylate dehydrogenase